MSPLLYALIATFLVSLLSFSGVILIRLKEEQERSVIFALVAFAAGALVAGALFHLFPAACEQLGAHKAGLCLFVGFSSFFILERFLRWRHCHKEHCELHPMTTLSLVGDGLHNFIDGAIIAATFVADVTLGITTAMVIAAHELPQELGDYGILIRGGFSRKKALLYNFASSLTAIAGTIAGYAGFTSLRTWIPYAAAFAAGNFIYVGASDLIPELHREKKQTRATAAFVFFLIGSGVMYALVFLNH